MGAEICPESLSDCLAMGRDPRLSVLVGAFTESSQEMETHACIPTLPPRLPRWRGSASANCGSSLPLSLANRPRPITKSGWSNALPGDCRLAIVPTARRLGIGRGNAASAGAPRAPRRPLAAAGHDPDPPLQGPHAASPRPRPRLPVRGSGLPFAQRRRQGRHRLALQRPLLLPPYFQRR